MGTSPRARVDLAEIAAYYGLESLNLELRFLDAASEAFEQLAVMPHKGAKREYVHPTLRDVRMWPIPGFPKILIFYDTLDIGIEVVRVLHSSRDVESTFTRLV